MDSHVIASAFALAAIGLVYLRRWYGNRPLACVALGEGEIIVRDRNGYREMVARGRETTVWTRCSLEEPTESAWPYIDLFHLAAALARSRRRVLFIGCGGAVALRQFAAVYPGIAMDLVEREPTVVALAQAWFGLDGIPGVTVHIDDGVAFVERALESTWDVAIVDAFDATELAKGLTQRAFFATLKRVLQRRDGGGQRHRCAFGRWPGSRRRARRSHRAQLRARRSRHGTGRSVLAVRDSQCGRDCAAWQGVALHRQQQATAEAAVSVEQAADTLRKRRSPSNRR